MTNQEILEKAKKNVAAMKGWYGHFIGYAITIVLFFILNMATSPDRIWFHWPAILWGVSIVIHYFAVFGIFGIKSDDWESEELEKEVNRLSRNKKYIDKSQENTPYAEDDKLELKELQKEKQIDWDERDFV